MPESLAEVPGSWIAAPVGQKPLTRISPGFASGRSGPTVRKICVGLCFVANGVPDRGLGMDAFPSPPRHYDPQDPWVRGVDRQGPMDSSDWPVGGIVMPTFPDGGLYSA